VAFSSCFVADPINRAQLVPICFFADVLDEPPSVLRLPIPGISSAFPNAASQRTVSTLPLWKNVFLRRSSRRLEGIRNSSGEPSARGGA
jgi:hypothetical protein